MARTAWLIGFLSEKGYFQVRSHEIEGLYMDSAFTKILHFSGNHKSILPQGTESNRSHSSLYSSINYFQFSISTGNSLSFNFNKY